MSLEKLPARISYEKTDSGAVVEMRGTRAEIMSAIVRLIYSARERIGLDVDLFALALPMLVQLEKATLTGSEMIDMGAIRQAKDGGAHE